VVWVFWADCCWRQASHAWRLLLPARHDILSSRRWSSRVKHVGVCVRACVRACACVAAVAQLQGRMADCAYTAAGQAGGCVMSPLPGCPVGVLLAGMPLSFSHEPSGPDGAAAAAADGAHVSLPLKRGSWQGLRLQDSMCVFARGQGGLPAFAGQQTGAWRDTCAACAGMCSSGSRWQPGRLGCSTVTMSASAGSAHKWRLPAASSLVAWCVCACARVRVCVCVWVCRAWTHGVRLL
jgi:hypothetical protein